MAKRVNTNAYEMAPINPGWIKKIVPEEYADDGLRRIVLFYVINTICADLSSSSIEMKTYGWSKDVWKNSKLKNRLYDVANLKKETLIAVKSIGKLKEKFESANLKKGFQKERDVEKAVFYKPSRYNEFMALCYHIRNALAHGRFTMYPASDGKDIVFVMEDGIKANGEFQVRGRMILKKSTLLKWIDIIEKEGDNENGK